MSFETTEVLPNNSKDNSEIPMVPDDNSCIVNDVEMRKDENNQSITVEVLPVAVTEEIPPKYDLSSEVPSTFGSRKSKKRKLLTFDELLESLDANVLVMNFTKLLLFLESNNKELTFPFNLKCYEKFFEMIVQDINILKSKSLDADYRDICDRIILAATGFLLTYVYEYRQNFLKIVMVIKKEPKNMMTCSCSTKSVKPSLGSISSGFKLHCLLTALAFVKNDVTDTEQFPELNLEQAHFVRLLLESIVAFTEFDSNLEIKDLYRSLWEAVRIYKLKYDFSIKCEESSGGKKNLLFEKVLKNIEKVPRVVNQIMNPKTDVQKPEAPKTEASKPVASKPMPLEPEPSRSKPWFPMPVIPKMPQINQNPTCITKRMLNNKLKMENESLFIKRLPSELISDTLNTIRDFLLDEDRHKLVLVPKTYTELDFYRNCLTWCRSTFVVSKFGNEFQEMHYQISCLLLRVNCTVNKSSANKINETTGIKEVSYIKERKHVSVASIPEPAHSFRNKKKHKRQNKAKMKATSMEAADKSPNQAKAWTDGSSSNCSSRATSGDRSKKVAQTQNVAKRLLAEINQSAMNSIQETPRSRRGEETIRKEQLKEALSVPVQSDKAMKMMRGMGWSGGALGARGEGITEPLMPSLDLARGAGLGHSRNGQSETTAMKPRESKTAPAFVSETVRKIRALSWSCGYQPAVPIVSENSSPSPESDKMETDVIVLKTKHLLCENPTLDKIMESIVELPKSTKTAVELPKPIKANVEPSKPSTSNAKQQLQPLKTLPEFSNEFVKPRSSESRPSFRQEIMHSILELFNSDAQFKILTYENKITKKERKFVGNTIKAIRDRSYYGIFEKEEHAIYREIQNKHKKLPEVSFETLYSLESTRIQIKKKLLTEVEMRTQQELPSFTRFSLNLNTEKITEETVHSYIMSSGNTFESERAYDVLKFKVLFLLNILNFVKSINEEVEVTFNKFLNLKQQVYIENVVDEINMRITFGSSPAETNLCAEIKNYVKDAFLGCLFNHKYTVVTLNKYFRLKQLNRPDNAVKRACQTTVNLDAFSSETFSASKLNINEPTVKENNNKVAENNSKVANNNSASVAIENNAVALAEEPKVTEFVHYESDSSSDEENNNNYTVPKLPPGEDSINILPKCLYLYDKVKTVTAGVENNTDINNDSASKNVTDNRNKNNIGNGNIVIDNNDNQVIDMKRDGGTKEENNIVDTEMAEYVVCVDYTEEVVDSGEMTVDINKEKEVIITEFDKDGEEIDQPMKHSDTVVANDVVEMVNQHKEIGIDNVDKMIDEGLSKTEDIIDGNVEDSDSNDCTDTINDYNPSTNENDINEDTDVLMIEVYDEPMEGISNTEKSKEVINKEDSVKEMNKEESEELMNQGESMEEINNIESSKYVEVAKTEDGNSNNPSDDQILKRDLEIKTDGDIISKEKLVLSEALCDIHSVGLSHVKTKGTETNIHDIHISKDTEIKTVHIVHTNHPFEELTNENVKEIQRHISNSIFLATQLPLLKCHGVQNGALIYSCHNKNTYDWLQNIVSVPSYVKVLNTKEATKMALKLYCFFDFDTKDLFRMIEWYNQELSTKDWVVEKTEKDGDSINIIVSMDKFSIKFIQESDLALFAGIDKILFSPVWD